MVLVAVGSLRGPFETVVSGQAGTSPTGLCVWCRAVSNSQGAGGCVPRVEEGFVFSPVETDLGPLLGLGVGLGDSPLHVSAAQEAGVHQEETGNQAWLGAQGVSLAMRSACV